MTNILLTGASGFIGNHICHKLLDNGYQVFAPVRKESVNKLQNLWRYKGLHLIEGAFYDVHRLEQEINAPLYSVVHLASIRGAGKGSGDEYRRINVHGTEALLDFAGKLKIPQFIYISSVGVLGTIPQHQPAGPSDSANPDNDYHETKFQAEQLVRTCRSDNVRTLILRPTITYGPGDNGFIPRLVQMVRDHKFVMPEYEVYIHLLNVLSFADFVVEIIGRDVLNGQIYHVADESPVSLHALVDLIAILSKETKFSGFRKWPGLFFRAAEKMIRLAGMTGLLTSLQLISHSWTYDISKTVRDLKFQPVRTMDTITDIIQENLR